MSTTPLVHTHYEWDPPEDYKCKDEFVELVFHSEEYRYQKFSMRTMCHIFITLPPTLGELGFTLGSLNNEKGNSQPWLGWWGLVGGITMAATGIFCKSRHLCFEVEPDKYRCINDFNLCAGIGIIFTNSICLLLNYLD